MTFGMRPLTRRQLLAGGAATAGVGLSSRLGHLVERAYAAEPTACAPLSDIEHVVFVMQENRSYDHYFGTYRKPSRGFSDPDALRHRGVFKQHGYSAKESKPDKDAFLPPWHLDTMDTASFAECVDDITHDWGPQHHVLDGGKMDDWVKVHLAEDGQGPAGGQIGPITMGHYDRGDLPFYYALADAFTLCDGYFSSVIGPTDPNRVMWFSATVDPDGQNGGPVLDTLVANRLTGDRRGKFTWKTMPEVLQEAGVSWKVYTDTTADVLLNPLPYFKIYNEKSPYKENAYGANTILGNKPNLGTFQLDVAANRLPKVSWLFPAFDACEHPSAPPSLGEAFISSVLETLVDKPEVWEKTALFVMYDENGGFFDHVVPPTAPKGTAGEYVTVDPLPDAAAGIAGPVGLGFRVPMLVLSPYSRGGLVCSDTFDHTSQLKFLETRFGTPVPNLSAWRRKTVGDLTGAFNFAAKPVASASGLPNPPSVPDLEAIGSQCLVDGPTGVEDKGFATPVPKDATTVPSQESDRGRGAGRPSGLDHCETPSHHHPGGPPRHHGGQQPHRSGGQQPHLSGGRPVNRARPTGSLAKTGADTGIPLGAAALTGIAALVYRLRSRGRAEEPK